MTVRHWVHGRACNLLVFAIAYALIGARIEPGRARAQDENASASEEYRVLIEEALQEFDRGHWDEASLLFEQAHRISPSARTLRGMGLAAYEARRYVDAIAHLSAALGDERRALLPEQRTEVARILEHAQTFVARVAISSVPAAVNVSIDGRAAQPSSDGDYLVDPGLVELEIAADGYDSSVRQLRVGSGQRQTLSVTLKRAGVAAEPVKPAVPEAARTATASTDAHDSGVLSSMKWISGAAAVSGLAAGAVFLVLQKQQAAEFNRSCVPGMFSAKCAGLHERTRSGGTWYTASIVGFAVGGALAATSAILFMLDGSSERQAQAGLRDRGCVPGFADAGAACWLRF